MSRLSTPPRRPDVSVLRASVALARDAVAERRLSVSSLMTEVIDGRMFVRVEAPSMTLDS